MSRSEPHAAVLLFVNFHIPTTAAGAHQETLFPGAKELGPYEFSVQLILRRLKGARLEWDGFTRGPCESGKAFNSPAGHQGFITAMELGHSFLYERDPQLFALGLQVYYCMNMTE